MIEAPPATDTGYLFEKFPELSLRFSAAPPLIDSAVLPEVAVEHTVSPHVFRLTVAPLLIVTPGLALPLELPRAAAPGAGRHTACAATVKRPEGSAGMSTHRADERKRLRLLNDHLDRGGVGGVSSAGRRANRRVVDGDRDAIGAVDEADRPATA